MPLTRRREGIGTQYRGTAFLGLKGPKGKPVVPTTTKGGHWLAAAGKSNPVVAHFCRGVTGHAPIGEYRTRFHLPGITVCQCMFHPNGSRVLQTRDHLIQLCPLVDQSTHRHGPTSVVAWVGLLEANKLLFAFPLVNLWDPG